MSIEVTSIYSAAKEVMFNGCPNGEGHFLRCDLSADDANCRVWCNDCGWEITIRKQGAALSARRNDGSRKAARADRIAKWIESRGGSVSPSWELERLAELMDAEDGAGARSFGSGIIDWSRPVDDIVGQICAKHDDNGVTAAVNAEVLRGVVSLARQTMAENEALRARKQ